MTLLAVCSSAFAENNVGMSKNCGSTKAGTYAGTATGIAVGMSASTWLTGTACFSALVATIMTGGAASVVAVTPCTATAAAVGATTIVGGAIGGAKIGEQAGKALDGAGCE